jgi:hypothetical protein
MSDLAVPAQGAIVPTQAQWAWTSPAAGEAPVVTGYPTTGGPTKSGLLPGDLANYILLPLQTYSNPPIPVPDPVAIQWIRWAEDDIENETSIRLCQTWIAAPPAKTQTTTQLLNLGTQYNYQQLGVDYDFSEPAYDFFYQRAKDEGWLYQRLRWRPVKGVDVADPSGIINPQNLNGVQNMAFIYPLLNEFFRMPQTWIVEDQNRGLVRFVPATNVQMLPLFAMQLAFMGFAQTVPGGLWFQYKAGLTANDYASGWSFMRQLVLAKAGITALGAMQTSLNMGSIETYTQADGLALRTRYSEKGPFYGAIANLQTQVDRLIKRAKMAGGGIHIGLL